MSEHITVRLPAELRAQLAATAKRVRKSRSALMVEALQAYLGDIDKAVYEARCDETCRLINAADAEDPGSWEYMDAATADLLSDDPPDEDGEW